MSELDATFGGTSGSAESTSLVAVRLSERYGRDAQLRRVLAVSDLLALALCGGLVIASGGSIRSVLLLVLFAPAWIVIAKVVGLYDRDHRTLRHLTVDELPWIVVWASAAIAFLSLILAPFPSLALTMADRLRIWAFAAVLGLLLRASARAIWRRVTPPQRVLIVGEGSLADAVARKLELFPDIHAEIHGTIPSCAVLHEHLDQLDGVDRVVVACRELNEEILEELLPACRLRGVKLAVVPPSRGMFGTATQLDHVADLPLLDYNTWDVSRTTLAMKRIFDVTAAVGALIVTAPLFVLVALAILVDGGFPVFFRQLRAGQGGQPFEIVKFRTMVRDAEAMLRDLVSFDDLDDPMFKLKADPRVTRVGRFLRRTSLDELPQLFNVVRGEMSIVGPRPELLDLVDRYAPEHAFRLRVKPGITGPWQVFGRSELTFPEVLAVEREYVENLSLARDVRILLMTLPAVFGRRGAF